VVTTRRATTGDEDERRGGIMPYTPTPGLLIDHDGPIATVTLHNPEVLNAIRLDDMHKGLEEIWEQLASDTSVRVAVLTGTGSAFSSGGYIPDFVRVAEDPDYRREQNRAARRLMDALAAFPKPVVAAVNGPAVGLGCSIAIACDIVLMGESAYLMDPHIDVGVVAGDGGAALWPLLTSLVKAKEHLLLADKIPATEAVLIGLANRVVADDRVLEEAMSVARRLAEKPQQALQDTKRALNLHMQHAIALVAPFALAAEEVSFAGSEVRDIVKRFTST
jgi:enoyl-CoA hydratase/carnithine racemase